MLARLRCSCSAERWLSSSFALLVSLRILASSLLRMYVSCRFIASTCMHMRKLAPPALCKDLQSCKGLVKTPHEDLSVYLPCSLACSPCM